MVLFWITAFLLQLKASAQLPVQVSPAVSISEAVYQKPDSAYLYWKDKLQQFQLNNNLAGEADCLQEMGQILYQSGNYPAAIEKLLAADKIYHLTNNKENLADNTNLLGTVYYYSQQPVKAQEQFREALKLFTNTGNHNGLANTLGAIGHIFEKKRQYDSAFHYQHLALQQALVGGDRNSQAAIYENIGSIYEDAGNFDSAHYYFQQALQLYQQANNTIGRIEVINNLGDVFQKNGDYKNGLRYAREAMQLAFANKAIYQLQSAYRDMGQCFFSIGQHDSAYLYLEKSRALIQHIYTTENSQQIALQQAVYDTERKNLQINSLQSDKRIKNLLIAGGGILVLLLCLLGAVVISRQRLKLNNEKAINESNQQVYATQKGLMESELKRQQLQEENLQQQLEIKSSELSSHILHLIQKNEVMEDIKKGLAEILKDDKRDQKKQVRQVLQKINVSFSQDAYWEEFRLIFDKVHQSFFSTLTTHYPSLSAAELRLLSLIKMNLSSADIATMLGITSDSLRVNRYRVKKKLNLAQGESLTAFIQGI
jgi:tetratricopeptide (TPR) repeat protein